ncbi:AP-3 complex subunit mu [Neolecta irregularis DAH-3]|uniref:AP-3 complex subunit mu n=1 Tax=Neolecta irregularis (strain DAH-3) TaxID=1198029 RepID=A0A1U7LJH4_NEOID|nr:AP-3 complex subunit mu [Neolecta irregularis DAH-3]|eukprot:OLL22810.1 AP-3 complex subunit mu [Neolecta irregularis DAH-3]
MAVSCRTCNDHHGSDLHYGPPRVVLWANSDAYGRKEILQHPFRTTLTPAAFRDFVVQFKATQRNTRPILQLDSTTAIHIVREDVVFVATCFEEISPLVVLAFLERVAVVLEQYFGESVALRSVTIQSHLDVIEQLLDEMAEDGQPVLTEADALRDRVLLPTLLHNLMHAAGLGTE